jgi:hypothetical protein
MSHIKDFQSYLNESTDLAKAIADLEILRVKAAKKAKIDNDYHDLVKIRDSIRDLKKEKAAEDFLEKSIDELKSDLQKIKPSSSVQNSEKRTQEMNIIEKRIAELQKILTDKSKGWGKIAGQSFGV